MLILFMSLACIVIVFITSEPWEYINRKKLYYNKINEFYKIHGNSFLDRYIDICITKKFSSVESVNRKPVCVIIIGGYLILFTCLYEIAHYIGVYFYSDEQGLIEYFSFIIAGIIWYPIIVKILMFFKLEYHEISKKDIVYAYLFFIFYMLTIFLIKIVYDYTSFSLHTSTCIAGLPISVSLVIYLYKRLFHIF